MKIAAHVRAAWNGLVYVTTGWVLGMTWFVVLVTVLAVGAGLSVILIGVPVLAAGLSLTRWGAQTERARAALVLGAPVDRPSARPEEAGAYVARWRARLRGRTFWRELAYMAAFGLVATLAASVAVALWSAALAALAAPAVRSAAPDGSLLQGLGPAELAVVVVGGLLLAAVAVPVTAALGTACGRLAATLLAPDARAELAARVETLEATRAAAVESSDARLRRIERDLHDGAQHRLTYIAMELDRARAKVGADPEGAEALLARAHEESRRALVELRDVVRGIHPSVLTDRGLDAAISGLAERSPVPVTVEAELPTRPRPAAETAAYYVVAEALTNVARHSGATAATVAVRRRDDGRLEVEVSDDGRGGARRAPGSGLDGLAQRVEALDGTLTVDSPEGGPTTVKAVI